MGQCEYTPRLQLWRRDKLYFHEDEVVRVGIVRPDLARINKQYNSQTTLFFQPPRLNTSSRLPLLSMLLTPHIACYLASPYVNGLDFCIARTSACRVLSLFSVWVLGAEIAPENSLASFIWTTDLPLLSNRMKAFTTQSHVF
jgi:hypothetical protein